MSGDHFYCLDPYGELAPQGGYEREGITGYAFATAQSDTVPIYRFLNPSIGDHFYTTSPTGESGPPAWHSEGVAWHMYANLKPGTVAVYRWWNGKDHFYTTDPTGELAPAGGYHAEGILGYLYPDNAPGTVAVNRWFHSGLMSKFTFSNAITAQQKHVLLERHSFAYYRAGLTNVFSPEEKEKVRALYRVAISHDVDINPNANGSAIVGGRQLWVNFKVLFPQGETEIAQTLLHEMMHCAGYTHPAKSGIPGDGGPYFGSPPLRAELAIAGVQSDEAFGVSVAQVEGHDCQVIDVDATERVKAAAAGTLDPPEK